MVFLYLSNKNVIEHIFGFIYKVIFPPAFSINNPLLEIDVYIIYLFNICYNVVRATSHLQLNR